MSSQSETLHVSSVARNGMAVLIGGPSGSGKSDLALRLIDRGAQLISDDYTIVHIVDGRPLASPPPTIAGKIEVRGLGIVDLEHARDIPVALFVDLGSPVERLPDAVEQVSVAGIEVPRLALNAFEPSAAIKVELALDRFGCRS